jgi:hypothetical protein
LRVQRRDKPFSWLCNGQPGRNAQTVAAWDESHRYQLTAEEWILELDENFPRENWLKILGTGALRLPAHLTLDEVVQASSRIKPNVQPLDN